MIIYPRFESVFAFFMAFNASVAFSMVHRNEISNCPSIASGFAPIFPDICYHLTHYKPAAADIPVASDNP
ncbi:hypothetical protein ACPE62_002017, partial [Escherichia coli]